MSRTLVQRLIKQGEVTVNGRASKCSYEPAAGDIIELRVAPPPPLELTPENIPIDVIYEDEHLLAINKQIGIICHPARSTQSGTIANAVAFYAGGHLSRGSEPFRPGIIHRLDKNTSGVMVIAKNDEAHWRLSLQFEQRRVEKVYFAIVEGEPRLDRGLIDQPLAAHPAVSERHIVPGFPTRQMLFKEAVTRYEVQQRFRGFAIVHLFPKTGRTHQLRVHMSAIGHPLVGDKLYGGHFVSERDLAGEGSEDPLIVYQCLHAFRLSFTHPITGQPTVINAPLTPKLQHIVDLLRRHRAR